jgi:hypothetical protein
MINNVDWGDKNYMGYSFFEYDSAKSILIGDYKIEVTDKAGNIAENFFQVEIPNADIREPYKVPEIKYQIKGENSGKEIKITGDHYNSCDIKVLSNPELWSGSRKKFSNGDKIILNKKEGLPSGSVISVRINQDVNETRILFLRNFSLTY